MSKEWSNWFLLSEDNLEKVGNIPGIYRIKLVYKNNGKDKPIPRFLKEDKQGIIYIGETMKGLKRRLGFFKKAYLDDKYHPHSGGNLLHFIIKKIIVDFEDKYELHFSYISFNKNTESSKLEEDLRKEEKKKLEEYFMEFGELPILNSETPFRKDQKNK